MIDRTGIKAEGEGAWFAKKHGLSKPRQWRKVHLGIDADTLEIRAIEVTGSWVGDAPMLPELLNQIPTDQPIGKVSADGAYDTPGVPRRHRGAQRLCRHSRAQECTAMAGEHTGRAGQE